VTGPRPVLAALALAAVLAACATSPGADGGRSTPDGPSPTTSTAPLARPSTDPPSPTATTRPAPGPTSAPASPTPTPEPARLVAAGDIAACDRDGDEATARLLDDLPGTVAALGDLAYPNGTAAQLRDCYGPTWGRHVGRTRPALGNHDYGVDEAAAAFDLFGESVGARGEGWYAFDLGPSWRAVVLNTNCWAVGGCGPGSPQYTWLEQELADHPDRHVVAYGHHPRFSSGRHGSDARLTELFALLDRGGVVLYLAGHDHHYERFAPSDATGTPSPDGVRQFVVGTGGYSLYPLGPALPTTEVRSNVSSGVLALELLPDRYRWRFHATDPGAPEDHGEAVLGPPG
jgi:hypothetical protein